MDARWWTIVSSCGWVRDVLNLLNVGDAIERKIVLSSKATIWDITQRAREGKGLMCQVQLQDVVIGARNCRWRWLVASGTEYGVEALANKSFVLKEREDVGRGWERRRARKYSMDDWLDWLNGSEDFLIETICAIHTFRCRACRRQVLDLLVCCTPNEVSCGDGRSLGARSRVEGKLTRHCCWRCMSEMLSWEK